MMSPDCYSRSITGKLAHGLAATGLIVGVFYVTGIADLIWTGDLPVVLNGIRPEVPGTFRTCGALIFIFAILLALVLTCWSDLIGAFYQRRSAFFHRALIAATVVVVLIVLYQTWHFDLDDKWVYYRTSLNVLRYGIPYFNQQDGWNVQTSLAWPYLIAPGHWTPSWEFFSKTLGFAFVLCLAGLCVATVRHGALKIVAGTSVALFFPLLLWSLGCLETSASCFQLAFAAWLLCRQGGESYLGWLMLGASIYFRPDAILVGSGALAMSWLYGTSKRHAKMTQGFCLCLPVLLYLGYNVFFFSTPLPGPFYIKGFNKIFSGAFPLIVDIRVGVVHLLSALALGLLPSVATFHALRCGLRDKDFFRKPPAWVLIGCLCHLSYTMVCGYQHMSFTFRYYLPSLITIFCVSLPYLDQYFKTDQRSDRKAVGQWLALASFVQIPLTLYVTFFSIGVEFALTRAPLRDAMNVNSLAQWMKVWREGAEWLKNTATSSERIFMSHILVAGSLPDAYALDFLYVPLKSSANPEIREAAARARDFTDSYSYTFGHFDYVCVQPRSDYGPKGLPALPHHELIKSFYLADQTTILAIFRLRQDAKKL